ncbi:MAG: xanthine dehydrogenase family protein molybdopterin-binding subunit [Vulcanimicrobiota bacterium]
MRTILQKNKSCQVPESEEKYRTVGKSLKRYDAIDKVTGQGKYIDDLKLQGMLFAKVLRSKYAHADLLSIDTKEAEKIQGVWAVVTGKKFAHKRIGECINDQPVMAHTKVRFIGEPVAAVIADTPEIATRALELIRVEYRPEKPVFDPREAMKPDAPIIHEDLHEYECFKTFCPQKGTNIFHHFKVRKGNVDKGFDEADRIFEHEFSFPHISHCQMEPHGCIAYHKTDGMLEVYASAQSPFLVRNVLTHLFDKNHSQVRVVVPYIGGGFGGKSDCTIEPLAALIASEVPGKPVKLVLEREEMFCGSVIGRGCHVKIRTGVTKDGMLTARKIDLAFNAGAYGEYCINIIVGGGQNSTGPYFIPNVQIDSHAVYTNLPYVGAYRGYGHPEGHWAAERQMDIIAGKMGFDPAQFRLKNLLSPGKTNAIGQTIEAGNGDPAECLRQVAKALDWENWKKISTEKKDNGRYIRGKGFASLMKSPVMATSAPSMCQLRFNEDCSVNIQVSATDMGQGSTTALSQIAAETLKIDPQKVRVSTTIDTERHPYDWQTVASRTTWMCGNAVVRACMEAIGKIKNMAAQIWELDSVEKIEYDGTNVKAPGGKCLPVKSLIMGYVFDDGMALGGPVTGTGYFLPPKIVYHDPETGQGNAAAEWTFGAQGVDMSIDKLTGEIKVHKLVTAMDVGKVINPVLARGQLIGAMVQAFGPAHFEEMVYSGEGLVRNDNLTDYKVPTVADLADTEIEVIFLETPQHDGPYGARPLAEHGTVGVAPAFANAIRNATGAEFYHLPVTTDKIMAQLGKEEN